MFLQSVFIVSALLTVLSSIMVIFTRNIMYACVYLLGSLIGVAGLYLTLGADLLAATQLLVYIGGVVILMVFAVMITGGQDFMKSQKFALSKVPFMGNMKTYIIGFFSAAVMGSVVYKLVINIITRVPAVTTDSREALQSTVEKIGVMLVTDHILAFEIASVLLLGAMIGASMIARPKRGSM